MTSYFLTSVNYFILPKHVRSNNVTKTENCLFCCRNTSPSLAISSIRATANSVRNFLLHFRFHFQFEHCTTICSDRHDMMHIYTDSQQIALAIVPKFTALISVMSMSYAVKMIIRCRKMLRRMYHRMFLGFAIYDITQNLTFITGTWAIPSGIEDTFWNTGTDATCKAQAFFSQLGLGSQLYLSALCMSLYFAVKNDFQEIRYRKFEKIAHICSIIVPMALAICLVSFNVYAPECKFYVPAQFYHFNLKLNGIYLTLYSFINRNMNTSR